MKRYTIITVLNDFTLKCYDFHSLAMAIKTYNKIKYSCVSCDLKDNLTLKYILS